MRGKKEQAFLPCFFRALLCQEATALPKSCSANQVAARPAPALGGPRGTLLPPLPLPSPRCLRIPSKSPFTLRYREPLFRETQGNPPALEQALDGPRTSYSMHLPSDPSSPVLTSSQSPLPPPPDAFLGPSVGLTKLLPSPSCPCLTFSPMGNTVKWPSD